MHILVLSVAASMLATGSAPRELPYEAKVKALAAANPTVVQLGEFGASRAGHPLHMLQLAAPGEGAPAPRPALLIVAGADGEYAYTSDIAAGLAEKLIADHKEVLARVTVYIVPCLNPDAAAWKLDPGHPKMSIGRAPATADADHDGRSDEDGAEDLNGDGMITMMRVANPAPGSGLSAEYMVDPDEARLLKKADAVKGERATYALLIEGVDNDGDGRFNEDGVGGSAGGGVDLNMNTPYRWPEFSDGAGPYQLSEPETLSLAQWMLSHEDIAAVLVLGPHDNLLNIPPTGRFEPNGQVPSGIEDGDKGVYEEVAKLFKDITQITGGPAGPDAAGSIHGWAYADYGVFSFSTPAWVRPDLLKKKDEPKQEDKPVDAPAEEAAPKADAQEAEAQAMVARFASAGPAEREQMMADFQKLPAETQARVMNVARSSGVFGAQPAGGGQPGEGRRPRGGRGQGGPPGAAPPGGEQAKKGVDSDDGKWLKYSDEQRGGTGYIAWAKFQHPQLGEVEIGGFVPGFKTSPPEGDVARLIDEQAKFAAALAAKLPRLEPALNGATAERLGPGLWRIRVRLTNEGYLPTMSAIGVKARRAGPTLLTIDRPVEAIVSGQKIVRWWAVNGSGGTADAEWIVRADDGSTVSVSLKSAYGGVRVIEIKLVEAAR